MMGHVNALTAPYDDDEAYQAYIDGYVDYRLEQFEFIKKYYDVDFVMMHDDWGNEKQMFMSPEMWRQFYKEPERRMAKRCHELGIPSIRIPRSFGHSHRQPGGCCQSRRAPRFQTSA